MTSSVVLPEAVLAALAPAREILTSLAREGVHEVLDPKIIRSAQVAIRVNGNDYLDGMRNVLAASGLDPDLTERRVPVPAGERAHMDEGPVDDHEDCDDHNCEECYSGHSTYACCGYCPDCERHRDDTERDEVCSMGHCHSCEHECDNW
jgi:hypothetical protein